MGVSQDPEALRLQISNLYSQIETATTSGNFDQLSGLSNQLKQTELLLNKVELRSKLKAEIASAKELLSDSEMAEVAEQELQDLEPRLVEVESEIEDLTIPPLADDDKKALMEIRAGTGGTEASIFAEEALRMYTRYFTTQGLKPELISISHSDEAGIKEAVLEISHPGAYGLLRFESGVHRVQRVPVTEAAGRIHTSAITIAILPQVDATKIELNEKDLRIDVYRAGGPGGQSVNTTDSAVRITHIPTGLVATSQDSKSQHKNKEKALSVIVTKLYALEQEKREREEASLRSNANLTGDRSAKIRTYNFPQGRITDHRIHQSWFNIEAVLEGELDEIITTVNKRLRRGDVNLDSTEYDA